VTLNVGAVGEESLEEAGAACLPADGGTVPDLTALYRSQRPSLLRFFNRRTADPQEAQDLVQEAFVRMIGVAGGPELRKPEAYLTRIAQNLLRDRAKTRFRRSASTHIPADDAILAGTDQNRLLETRDLLDRLDHAMLELAPDTREIFMAHRLEGLTYAEIAERTGLTIKQVEKAISRSLLELDRALGPR
jgi:RNA polymerase sigma-70 factor (ECF subfamily)